MANEASNDFKAESLNSVMSTRDNMNRLIDEIETLCKELILQTINSNKTKPPSSDPNSINNELLELSKLIVQKQSELSDYLNIAADQQLMYNKINKLKQALVESNSDLKSLLIYLKEAEQVLASAVYQSRLKLNMIKKAKPLPSEEIIKYAHKISSDYGVCCPENWIPDNPRRPYPTDADMRKGWLAKMNQLTELNPSAMNPSSNDNNALNSNATSNENDAEDQLSQRTLMRSNSKIIDPIVPEEFSGFNKEKIANNSTEFMSDSSNDSSSDSDMT